MNAHTGPVLFVGATGKLGRAAVPLILDRGHRVRAMSRDPARARSLAERGAEVVRGDLRDPVSVTHAVEGAGAVVAASHGMTGGRRNGPSAVDAAGTRTLIDAARAAGVNRFVFVSASAAAEDQRIDFFRIKADTERYLESSGLSYTILRPTAFMETWAEIIGQSIAENGKAVVFGAGENPINFISVEDVARFVVLALEDERLNCRKLEIGGPDNLTLNQVVAIFERVLGRKARPLRIPVFALRLMAAAARPFSSVVRRMLQAGIMMSTEDCAFDPAPMLARFPMRLTRLEDLARRHLA